MIAEIVDG